MSSASATDFITVTNSLRYCSSFGVIRFMPNSSNNFFIPRFFFLRNRTKLQMAEYFEFQRVSFFKTRSLPKWRKIVFEFNKLEFCLFQIFWSFSMALIRNCWNVKSWFFWTSTLETRLKRWQAQRRWTGKVTVSGKRALSKKCYSIFTTGSSRISPISK